MKDQKRGGALRGLRINREILILRKPPIEVVLHTTQTVIEVHALIIFSHKVTRHLFSPRCRPVFIDAIICLCASVLQHATEVIP